MKKRLLLAGAALLLTVVYAVIAHVNYWPRGTHPDVVGFQWDQPWATSGDEPHYLVLTNSILDDHDIRLEKDFVRIEHGGYEAGRFWHGNPFGGHVLLRNLKTGAHVTCSDACTEEDAAKVGAPLSELAMVPAHPVGFPALLAFLALPFGTTPQSLEPLVGDFQILFGVLAVILTFAAARASGLREKHALASAAIVAFASPWLPYVHSFFSELAIGLFLIAGYLALRTKRFVLAGILVGVAMTMKPNFALFAIAWGAERLLARKLREAVRIGVGLGIVGVMFVGFNLSRLGVLVTTGTIPFAVARGLSSFEDTLVDREHGVLPFVPWTAIALVWGCLAAVPLKATTNADEQGRLPVDARRQLILPVLLSLGVYALVAWGPGYCYGPRYWVPLMPFLALLAVDFAATGLRRRTGLLLLTVVVSAVFAIPASVQYHWLFSKPASAAIFGPPPLRPPEPPPPHLEARVVVRHELAERVGREIHVKHGQPGIAFFGPWVETPTGSWKAVLKVRWGACDEGGDRAIFDVAVGAKPIVETKVAADADATQLELPFDAPPPGLRGIEVRAWTAACDFDLLSAEIVRADAPTPK